MSHQARTLRCGQFIREEIEKPSGIEHGWESWLERSSEVRFLRRVRGIHRVIDFGVVVAFTLLFIVYYCYSLALANQDLQRLRQVASTAGLPFLIVLGLAVLLVIVLVSWRPYLEGLAQEETPAKGAGDSGTGQPGAQGTSPTGRVRTV